MSSSTASAYSAVIAAIRAEGGWLEFSRYLDIALNSPQHGYYGSGRVHFGASGDFDTAPTISPLFGEAIAEQITQVLNIVGAAFWNWAPETATWRANLEHITSAVILDIGNIRTATPPTRKKTQRPTGDLAQRLAGNL